MKLLNLKIFFPLLHGQCKGMFNRNNKVLLIATYSRSSSNSRSPYKIVGAKIKSELDNFNKIGYCYFGIVNEH